MLLERSKSEGFNGDGFVIFKPNVQEMLSFE